MRYLVGMALLAPIAGCGDSPSDAAKAELAIVENSGGDPGRICAARRRVADAYLTEHKQREYESADLDARIACRRAAQQGY